MENWEVDRSNSSNSSVAGSRRARRRTLGGPFRPIDYLVLGSIEVLNQFSCLLNGDNSGFLEKDSMSKSKVYGSHSLVKTRNL